MDTVSAIMAYESGKLTALKIVEMFTELCNTGLAWSLQGSYGRSAQRLIDGGLILKDKNGAYSVNYDKLEKMNIDNEDE